MVWLVQLTQVGRNIADFDPHQVYPGLSLEKLLASVGKYVTTLEVKSVEMAGVYAVREFSSNQLEMPRCKEACAGGETVPSPRTTGASGGRGGVDTQVWRMHQDFE